MSRNLQAGLSAGARHSVVPSLPPPLAFCNLNREQQQKASRAIYRDKAIPTAAEIRLQKSLAKIFFLELL